MGSDIHYNSNLSSKRWVGYFDLLGVKSLFKTQNHLSVFVTLSSAIEEAKKIVMPWENVKYIWFSDTLIVYADDDSNETFRAIDNISRWLFYFLITKGDGIPVRGAISCDEFYIDRENNLFFGKALIEAYEYGEAQDWVGFLLCPSTEERLIYLGMPAKKLMSYAYTEIPFRKERSNLNKNLPALIIGNWVSINNQNPVIERLSQMKKRIVDENIRAKYDRAIEFIENNKRSYS
ncbi:MAG: hypothetical protein ABSE05_09460 [Syntrophales bacterium]|jgi:hypothetical protein